MVNDNPQRWIELLTYSLALWLGLYLLGRNPANRRLRWTGLGLVVYAISLGSSLLAAFAPTPGLALTLLYLHWAALFLPALFWFGAMVELLPETTPLKETLSRIRGYGLLLAIPFFLVSAGTGLVFEPRGQALQAGPAYFIFAGVVLLPVAAALLLVGRLFQSTQPRRPFGLLLLATLFFTLGAGALILPLDWLPRRWLLLLIGFDLELLGLAIAWLDALEEGETLLPDFFRSLDAAALAALLFGGPVILTIVLSTGLTFPMVALLLTTMTLAIASQVFVDPIQAGIDYVAFKAWPSLRQARADLRAAANTLPRLNETLDLETMDEAEFIRLTRRALSHMGNLPRLAASPLTRLPLVDLRLSRRQLRGETLERAAELKQVLTESICRLKPRDKGDFGTTEEWRHYNALYFPYVVGLKPYSRRADDDGLDPAAQEALAWFRTYVPERTLYNWQNAAAELVAKDLRERQKQAL